MSMGASGLFDGVENTLFSASGARWKVKEVVSCTRGEAPTLKAGKSQVDVEATTADSGLEILFASVRTRIYAHTT